MWIQQVECGSQGCIATMPWSAPHVSNLQLTFPIERSRAKNKISRVEKGVIIKSQEELRYMPKEIINACLVLREPGSPVQLSYSRKETRGEKSKTKPVETRAEKKAKRNP